jgi:hypothetical protein
VPSHVGKGFRRPLCACRESRVALSCWSRSADIRCCEASHK